MMWTLLLLVSACGPDSATSTQSHAIGYHAYLDASIADSVPPVSEAVLSLLRRCTDSTELHIAWTAWPSASWREAFLHILDSVPGAKVHLLVSPDMLPMPAPLSSRDSLWLARLAPQASDLLRSHNAMHSDFMLAHPLASRPGDDGRHGILYLSGPLLDTLDSARVVNEAVWIHGDSALSARFEGHWHRLRQGGGDLLAAQSHTYSNLHDHQAWFFPDADADSIGIGLLRLLVHGVATTRMPAKVRWVCTRLDRHHIRAISQLVDLQAKETIDLKIVTTSLFEMDERVAGALQEFLPGTVHEFSSDSLRPRALASNFMLIDGPYALSEGGESTPQQLVFLFGGGWDSLDMQVSGGAWLRIADADLFQAFEKHFDRIWEPND